MSTNLDTARAFYEGISRGELSIFDATFAPDFVDHELPSGVPEGLDGAKEAFAIMLGAFPDMSMVIEDAAEDGDKVWARVRMTGTHRGELAGNAPTGRAFEIEIVDILRFDDAGRVVEHWGVSEDLKMLQQLGFVGDDPLTAREP